MGISKRNPGHSIFTRLQNKAREEGEDFNFVLNRYGVERLVYRLSLSSHARRLILKGGTLFIAWQGRSYRVTRDLDLLATGSNKVADLETIFKELCSMSVESDDGIIFLAASVKGSEIMEADRYLGVRIKLEATLTSARMPLQVDIGFGDVITPKVDKVEYPTFLEMASPQLYAYPTYTVIAEKFEAMVSLGIINSRLKDFYDIWLMSRLFVFEGEILKQAIENTFKHRETLIPEILPVAFTEEFYEASDKRAQWRNFIKSGIETFGEEIDLKSVVGEIKAFLMPVITALKNNATFSQSWSKQNRLWAE